MRLRRVPGTKEKLDGYPELFISSDEKAGKWQEYFAEKGSKKPKLAMEIGAGRGLFLTQMATTFTDKNYIGLEICGEVLVNAVQRLEAKSLEFPANLAFLWRRAEGISQSFAAGEVDELYLNFSDPWPKKKHEKRRLTHKNFLLDYKKLLADDGRIIMKTDNLPLFKFSLDQFVKSGFRLIEVDYNYPLKGAEGDLPTEYETRFRGMGNPIYRLVAVKNLKEATSMKYISTRGNSEPINAATAIRAGMVPGGGLFVPESLPEFGYSWDELKAMKYQTLASKIFELFLTDYSAEKIEEIVNASYNKNFETKEIVPLVAVETGDAVETVNILELWHGPTAAFKDMALQILPRLLVEAVRIEGGGSEVDILVATSGDTGKAALEGFKNIDGIKVICFYPDGGVSKAQYLQMATTAGDNTNVVAVKGNFDDCQTAVKTIFASDDMNGRLADCGKEFSSANSINWGRLCPQIIYYFWSYGELLRQGKVAAGEEFNVVVPTGNFGNILAAYYAKEMGLPIHHLVCASNSNKVLADVLTTGTYDKRRDFVKTTSPSMDILVSSNFERFYFAMTKDAAAVAKAYADLDKDGLFVADEAVKAKWQEIMTGGYATEEAIAETVNKYFHKFGYTLDPHTAVAVKVYEDYKEKTGDNLQAVIASTASPFKFGRAVLEAITGEEVAIDSETEVLAKLAETAAIPVHFGLADVESLPILHDTVVKVDEIEAIVAKILEV